MSLVFRKLSSNAYAPTKATRLSAGFDLYSPRNVKIPRKKSIRVGIDIQLVHLPDECYCRIAPRSGMSLKNYVTSLENVVIVDEIVEVTLYNFGENEYVISKGDRIAQLVCEKIVGTYDDIYSPYDVIIPSKKLVRTRTDVRVNFLPDECCYGRIAPTVLNNYDYVTVLEDIVDKDVTVTLRNFGESDYIVRKGDKIAKLIWERIYYPDNQWLQKIDDVRTPTKTSTGFHLYSPYSVKIPSKKVVCVYTNLRVFLPDECYGRIASIMEMCFNNGVIVLGGVVDRDFEGNVGVILYNFSETAYVIRKGERIAQLICEQIYYPSLMEMTDENEIIPRTFNDSNRIRGSRGFGSSGGYKKKITQSV